MDQLIIFVNKNNYSKIALTHIKRNLKNLNQKYKIIIHRVPKEKEAKLPSNTKLPFIKIPQGKITSFNKILQFINQNHIQKAHVPSNELSMHEQMCQMMKDDNFWSEDKPIGDQMDVNKAMQNFHKPGGSKTTMNNRNKQSNHEKMIDNALTKERDGNIQVDNSYGVADDPEDVMSKYLNMNVIGGDDAMVNDNFN